MAKANRIEPCLFCNEAPCVCNKPAPKVRAPRKKVEPKPVKTTELDFAAEEPAAKLIFKVTHKADKPERDLSLEAALRNLMPILHPQSQTRAKVMLRRPYPRDVDMRVAQWKGGHGSGAA